MNPFLYVADAITNRESQGYYSFLRLLLLHKAAEFDTDPPEWSGNPVDYVVDQLATEDVPFALEKIRSITNTLKHK